MLEWSAVMSPKTWAQATFGEVRLGDERRTRRAVSLAEAIAREPNVSLPKQLSEPKEVKATYRLSHSFKAFTRSTTLSGKVPSRFAMGVPLSPSVPSPATGIGPVSVSCSMVATAGRAG